MRNTTTRRVGRVLMACASLVTALSMAACAGTGGDGPNENGGVRTTAADHDSWSTVADSAGKVWCTALRITPATGTDLDEAKLVSDLQGARTYDWIRVICSDNRSTNQREYAYLLLSTDSDYRQIQSAKSDLQGKGWNCALLDSHTYEDYVDSTGDPSYVFAETTYEK